MGKIGRKHKEQDKRCSPKIEEHAKGSYKCELCGAGYSTRGEIEQHMHQIHGI